MLRLSQKTYNIVINLTQNRKIILFFNKNVTKISSFFGFGLNLPQYYLSAYLKNNAPFATGEDKKEIVLVPRLNSKHKMNISMAKPFGVFTKFN